MQIGEYLFQCHFDALALLPPFKGSTLRGALGHALKKTVCALRKNNCDSCLLKENCPYPFLFEVEKVDSQATPEKARVSGRPHPYVLMPPADPKRHYNKGEPFSFAIKLFGRANTYLPHLLYCIELMGQEGLGSKKDTMIGTFGLDAVLQNDVTIYTADTKALRPVAPQDLALAQPNDTPMVGRLTILLKTPLRLKQGNQFQGNALPFETLVRAALRRISSLENHYGNGEPDLDYKGLVKRAGIIKTVHDNCRWFEFERYSNRQQTSMLLGGLIGTIEYEGDLTEFLPLLRYCEQTNLGKQTSFGLGQIQVSGAGSG